jgi:hypothetical protein
MRDANVFSCIGVNSFSHRGSHFIKKVYLAPESVLLIESGRRGEIALSRRSPCHVDR